MIELLQEVAQAAFPDLAKAGHFLLMGPSPGFSAKDWPGTNPASACKKWPFLAKIRRAKIPLRHDSSTSKSRTTLEFNHEKTKT
jgi:hypothetical protein